VEFCIWQEVFAKATTAGGVQTYSPYDTSIAAILHHHLL